MNLKLLFFLLFGILIIENSSAQKYETSFLPNMGLFYSINEGLYPKVGIRRTLDTGRLLRLPEGGSDAYFLKYNFTQKIIGAEAWIYPFGNYLRAGPDIQYSFQESKVDFSININGGIDFLSFASLFIGPEVNLTRNLDNEFIRFNINLEIIIPHPALFK